MSTFGERMRALGHAWERLERKPMYWPFVREATPATPPVHPARAHIHENRTRGERAADAVAAVIGSWRFVLGQNVFVLAWIIFNLIAIFGLQWDPRPFILLNLLFSWQASNTGPVLQLSSNRQAAKDRMRDDTEAQEVELSMAILHRLDEVVTDLHSHTTCVGHTTIGAPPPVTQQTTRKAKVKA